jgi:outer membrane protein OmpA-like peptidoglycan-associated protein
LVAKTVSLQKQIIGQEVGVGVYRFFGSDLVDINVGNKNQEPLQMGVRSTIEQGVIELLAAVTEVDAGECLGSAVGPAPAPVPVVAAPAAKPVADAAPNSGNGNSNNNSKPNGNGTATAVVAAPLSASDATQSGLAPQNSGNASASAVQQLVFEFGSSAISGAAMSAVEKIVNDVVQGPPVTFQLVARDTELWQPLQRRELTNQRVKVAVDALVAKGIAASRIGVTWMPEATDTSITRLGAGYQLVATLVVGK